MTMLNRIRDPRHVRARFRSWQRAQLGGHYTDRDKIMLIGEPVVIGPWLAEWRTNQGFEVPSRDLVPAGSLAERLAQP